MAANDIRLRRIRRRAWKLLAYLLIVVFAAAGGWLALRADGAQVHETAVGDLAVSVRPTLDGRVEVHVPVVDWQLSSDAFDSPIVLVVEARSVDRQAAARALANPQQAPQVIKRMQRDAETVLESAVQRATIVAIVGMIIGGTLGGVVVGAVTRRRRWLAIGLVEAVVVAGSIAVPSVADVRDLGVADLSQARLHGNARELPQLLAFAQQLLVVGDEYRGHYERALRSVSNSAAFAATRPSRGKDVSIVVASDLHNNLFVLDAFADFTSGDPVVYAGDFGQVGARIESRMAPSIAASADEVYAVSGNHDSNDFMESLSAAGVSVLTRDGLLDSDDASPIVAVEDLRIAGYDDPLEGRDGEPNVLRVYGDEYEEQVEEFIAWFEALPEVPDVVVVHQHGFAERLLEHLATSDLDQQVVILTGHDHKAHVDKLGIHAVVDAGTLGAGGPFAVGEQDASFARVRFRDGDAYAVDIAAIEPLTGRAIARRIILDAPHPRLESTHVSTRPTP